MTEITQVFLGNVINIKKPQRFVSTRFIYDLKIRKKLRPKIKFKGWHVYVVCRRCGKVIDKKFILPGLLFNAELLFCPNCALEIITKIFKTVQPQKSEEIQVVVEEELVN